jgi:hypothetical protein
MKPYDALDLRTTLSRRRLLRGLGALTVSLASPIWRPATTFGKDDKLPAPQRFIGVFSANGTIARDFFQEGSESEAPLSLGRILAPLSSHRDRLLVLKGVHMNSTVEDELGVPSANKPGGPHMKGPGAMLTGGSLMAGSFTGSGGPAGYADRISLDQVIAQRVGQDTAFASLEFGVRIEGQEPLRVISYRGANQPNLTVDDPWKMYERIFATAQLSAADLERLRSEQKSVLDFLTDDLTRLAQRVSSDDKARLEAHLSGIRSIEQRLSHLDNTCTPLSLPAPVDPREMENYPLVGRLQTDLMLLAHACDLTRVSTFMWANADSWQYYPWIGINEEHHELSHAGDDDMVANDKLVKINAWHAEQVAYVLDKLADTQDANGKSLLDDTLLLWGNELGAGNTHTYKNIPWLLATGSTAIETGRFLQYADDGQPHNNLLLAIAHAMGLTDLKTFGIPELCTGPLRGIL